jgi:hypothetical protein
MSTHIATRAELWEQLAKVDHWINSTPECDHHEYRYVMKGCTYCELHMEADRITRCLDRETSA